MKYETEARRGRKVKPRKVGGRQCLSERGREVGTRKSRQRK